MSTDSSEVYDPDSPQPVNALDAAVEAGASEIGSRYPDTFGGSYSMPREVARAVLQAALAKRTILLPSDDWRELVGLYAAERALVVALQQELARLVGVLTEAQYWDAQSATFHRLGLSAFIEQALGGVRP